MRLISGAAALALLVFVPALGAADGDWQSLFDGTSLAGWRANESPGSWRVENGAIVANGPRSHLFYVGGPQAARFRNFELEVEVLARPGADSGIYFHTDFQQSGWPAKGLEVQISNTNPPGERHGERRRTGSLVGLRNVYGQLVRDNEWFRLNITVRGKEVRVLVNGQLTVDYTEPDPPAVEGEYRHRVLSGGTFALQAHGPQFTVLFRNMRIRRLADDVRSTAPAPTVDATYRELLRLSGTNFPVVDYHTHLKQDLTLDDVLRRWHQQGIYAGIAVNGGQTFAANNDAALEPFVKALGGKPVFIAFQAEGREWVRLFSRAALERFDYIFTDSMTWTDDAGKRMRLWIDGEVGTIADPQKFMDMLVDRTVKILDTEPIDIYVNPTYLPNQLAARYDELWTADRRHRLVAALKANGIAMEINNRYMIPSASFITEARAAGVKFACGTNNAGSQDLGRMEYCIQMVRECHLTPEDMWVPPADGQKAIQRKPLIASQP